MGDITQLIEVADHLAIRQLTARYNRGFDDVDPDAYAATFTEDGVLEIVGGEVIEGREALAAMCRTTGYGVVHLTTDAIIDVDGDKATQDTYLIVANRTEGGGPVAFSTTGRYRDTLIRTDAGWRFQRRVVTLDGSLA